MQEIIESILNGRCVLFTGADFSKDPDTKNIQDNLFLRGGELAKKLLLACNEEESDDLGYASETYIEHKGRYDLINYLHNEFKCKNVSSLHEGYANLPWRNIYTTNYDDILEKANASLRALTIHSSIKMHTYEHPFLLHINGYIDTLTEESFDSEFKLTKTSYLIDEFNDSEWKHIFTNDIKTCDYLIFIGYSLSDFDIAKLLFQDEFINKKIIFITSKREDKRRDHNLKKYGQIFSIGKEDFLNNINSIKKDFTPKTTNVHFSSFQQIKEFKFENISITDEDVYDFFMFGKNNDNLICKSIIHNKKCCVESQSVNSILQELKSNIVNLSSEMGNGKTIMVEMIKCQAIQNGYEVFIFNEVTDSFEKELDEISKCKNKHIVIVENYHNKFDILKKLKLKLNTNANILLTERTVFENLFHLKVEEIFGKGYTNYDLNFLPDQEIEQLMDIFNTYGFGGYLSEKGKRYAQFKYLKKNLKRNMFLILLDLIDSPIMKEKSEHLFIDLKKKIQKNPKTYEAFIALSILSVLGRNYHILDFYDLLGNEVRLQNDFMKDKNIQQVINHENGYISIKSSIFANYILQKFIKDTKLIVNVLLKIIDNALKDDSHFDLAKELVNYSVLERILPQAKREELIYFYQEIKEYRVFSKNAHFWLQYAIAMISIGEFPRAEIYFTNAYAIFKKNRWTDTTKLDNHYARFLLEKNLRTDQNENFLEDFREAHKKLTNQILRNSNYFFPFKVASNYADFYIKFKDKFTNEHDILFIQNAIESIVKIINDMPEGNLKDNYFVIGCLRELSKVQKEWS